MHHRCFWLSSFCFFGENDAASMFLVVVALFFFGKMMHHRCFWSCKISGDGSPWGVAAILRAKIMDVVDANATVQNRPKSLEPSKYSGR